MIDIWYFLIFSLILDNAVFGLGLAIIISSIRGYRHDRERGEPELSPREFWLLGRGYTLLEGIFLVFFALWLWLTQVIYSS
jgi:hypothetical protein